MPKITLRDGTFQFPEGFLRSRHLGQNVECWLDQRAGALILLIEAAATLSIAVALALAYIGGRPPGWDTAGRFGISASRKGSQ